MPPQDEPSSITNPDMPEQLPADRKTHGSRANGIIVILELPHLRFLPPQARIVAIVAIVGTAAGVALYDALSRRFRDLSTYEFPAVKNTQVVLGGGQEGEGFVVIEGRATDIRMVPVTGIPFGSTTPVVTGFAADSVYDQRAFHDATGIWIALSETGSSSNQPVEAFGSGSVRGERKRTGVNEDAENRRGTARENEAGEILAAETGRHLERIPERKRGEAVPESSPKRPDYIDVETGETLEVYSPKTGHPDYLKAKVARKINNSQGDVLVVNTADSPLSTGAAAKAISELDRDKPVIIIDQAGTIKRIEPDR